MYQITHILWPVCRVLCAYVLCNALLFIWQAQFFFVLAYRPLTMHKHFHYSQRFSLYSPPLVHCHLFYSFIRLENNLFSSTSFYGTTSLFPFHRPWMLLPCCIVLAECIPASVWQAYSGLRYRISRFSPVPANVLCHFL